MPTARSTKSESSLKLYNKKRNFRKTKEPKGVIPKRAKGHACEFVIQEHHARRLHYDFRLEVNGVLKSWAVPKGPSLNPKDKRLAVQTEDHPLAYKDFEGVIPAGEYGGGHMTIWDKGTWIPPEDVEQQIEKGRLEFELKGEKVTGKWLLVRTKGGKGPKSSWLLIKRNDESSITHGNGNMTTETGQTVESFSRARIKQRKGNNDPMPKLAEPQLATLVEQPPESEEWVHEIKFDGYRAITTIENGKVTIRTRRGHDWTDKFASIANALKKVRVKTAIIDGEIVAVDPSGKTDFQRLQNTLKSGEKAQLIYYAFDLLYLNGEDLTDRPLVQRKELLRQMINQAQVDSFRFSQHFEKSGKDMLAASCKMKLEGIISKRADSPYSPGRSSSWLKIKCIQGQEFVIGGFTPPKGSRSGFGALLLGAYEDGKFRYVGKVGTGFTGASLAELHAKLKKIVAKTTPFEVASPREKGVTWVKPKLVANVQFTEFTGDRILRHPSFQGLREDKQPEAVVIEKEKPIELVEAPADSKSKSTKKYSKAKPAKTKFVFNPGGVLKDFPLTNPNKILFPKPKITKREVAAFYDEIQEWMLPLVANRPLALKRCPSGVAAQCFFQKHKSKGDPDELHSKMIFSDYKKENEEIIWIDSPEGLVSLVQMGAFEIHHWGSHKNDIDHPDQIVFDLDPDPGVKWPIVRDAAFEIRELLEQLELESFVKVTGGKGVHVQVPIDPIYDWDQIKSFSKTVVSHLSNKYPKRFLHQMSKSKRKGKIFLDYLRNGYGATSVVPFAVRAKANAPVALTMSWEDLKKVAAPDMYSIDEALKVLKKRKVDPWDGYLEMRQKIGILQPH